MSKEHLEANHYSMAFDIIEERYMNAFVNDEPEEHIRDVNLNKMTQSEVDEAFENLDIDKF